MFTGEQNSVLSPSIWHKPLLKTHSSRHLPPTVALSIIQFRIDRNLFVDPHNVRRIACPPSSPRASSAKVFEHVRAFARSGRTWLTSDSRTTVARQQPDR
jgi:hypothetical protein